MNNFPTYVIDTNIVFMAWYNPFGNCARILKKAKNGKIQLFSTDTVKKEIINLLRRYKENEEIISEFLFDLPITWVEKNMYLKFLEKTTTKHKADKPIEALSLALGCEIISADKHFSKRISAKDILTRNQ